MIRVGVIGTGYIARRAHLSNFARIDGVQVTALYNRTRAKAEAANAELLGGRARIHDTWAELIAADDVDAVSICTTADLHAAPALAALAAGKHVLCEKPLAATIEDADAIVAAVEAAQAQSERVILMVSHGLRFAAPYVLAKQLVASGKYGPVNFIRAFVGHAGAERRGQANVTWYGDDARGGNVLVDLGVHELDLMHWLAGSPPESAAAVASTRRPDLHGAAFDNVAVTISFQNGVIGSLLASWSFKPGFEREVIIGLAGGWIDVRGSGVTVHEAASGEAVTPQLPALPEHGGDKLHFIECIRERKQPLVTAREGRTAVAMALAGIESARTGRAVPIEA